MASDLIRSIVEPVVRNIVSDTISKIVSEKLDRIVPEVLNQPGVVLKPWVWRGLIAAEMMCVDRTLTRVKADSEADAVLEEVLRETRVWGNPDYAWDAAAARQAAHAFSIDHWERTP